MNKKLCLILSLMVCAFAAHSTADEPQIKSVVIKGIEAKADSPYILKLDDSNFDEAISEGIVVVDYYATWCYPCKMLTPVFAKVAEEMHGSVTFGKVNVDEAPQSSSEITSIPTLIIYKDGKEVKRVVGYMDADKLRQFVLSAI